MGTRFDHKGLYEPRVDTVTDVLGDTAQQQVKELFAPRIAKLSRNALNVMPFPFEFFQRIRSGRRCSCFSVEDDPAAQCLVCFGTGIVGGYVKRGCRLFVLDVTSSNVRCVNVAPDYQRLTRPTGFTLQQNTTYGYLETEIEIHQNIGVLDHLMVRATTLHGAYVEPFIKSPVDEEWVPLTDDSMRRRLGYRHLGLRVVFRRQGPSDPYPSLATIRLCYASIPNRTVRADIPRVTESKTLEDFGIYESFSSQTFFLDAELKNITTEDFFYAVMDGTRWKCIETKANIIAGVNTSWDLICRLVQSYEPMVLVPAGETLAPTQRPPASIISVFEAAGSPVSKAEAASEPLPLQLNASENTPWRQDPAPYKHVQAGLIAEESLQISKDSKKT